MRLTVLICVVLLWCFALMTCSVNSANQVIRYNISTIAGLSVEGYNSDNILATEAKLYRPYKIAVLNNDLFIADGFNHRIRKISSSGTITSYAGNGNAGFTDDVLATSAELNKPYGVCVDKSGNMFIADSANNRIRKVSISTSKISTIAGTGTSTDNSNSVATKQNIYLPFSVDVDSNGNVYLTDTYNHVIR